MGYTLLNAKDCNFGNDWLSNVALNQICLGLQWVSFLACSSGRKQCKERKDRLGMIPGLAGKRSWTFTVLFVWLQVKSNAPKFCKPFSSVLVEGGLMIGLWSSITDSTTRSCTLVPRKLMSSHPTTQFSTLIASSMKRLWLLVDSKSATEYKAFLINFMVVPNITDSTSSIPVPEPYNWLINWKQPICWHQRCIPERDASHRPLELHQSRNCKYMQSG